MIVRGTVLASTSEKHFAIQSGPKVLTLPISMLGKASPPAVGDKVFVYCPSCSTSSHDLLDNQGEILVLPDIFTPLAELSKDKYSTACCVLIKTYPPIKSKGTDYLFTLSVVDEGSRIDLKIFMPTMLDFHRMLQDSTSTADTCLETQYQSGDIFIIKNIRKAMKEGVALIHKSSELQKIGNVHNNKSNRPINQPTDMVVQYFCQVHKDLYYRSPPRMTIKIEDIKADQYFNVIGKLIYVDHGMPTTLCIVDYTSNPLITRNKKGLYNLNMLLYIKAYGKHASSSKNLVVGSVYFFENLKTSFWDGCLVAYLSEGKYGGITLETNEFMLKRIMERESEYFSREQELEDEISDRTEQKESIIQQARCECGRGRRDGVVRPEEKRCSCNKEALPRTGITDIRGPGLYLLRAVVRVNERAINASSSILCVVCDGINVLWAELYIKEAVDGWSWVLLFSVDPLGVNNYVLGCTKSDRTAREWQRYLDNINRMVLK